MTCLHGLQLRSTPCVTNALKMVKLVGRGMKEGRLESLTTSCVNGNWPLRWSCGGKRRERFK